MDAREQTDNRDGIVWHDGIASFRGFPVEHREVNVARMTLRIASMRDATHLLDQPDIAQRFLETDMAPYGVELWPAAMMLAEYIHEHDAGPHNALEIGCGLGLVSIVAARMGWTVVAGDHEPSALMFARHNAELNEVSSIEFRVLDWNDPPPGRRFSRILGADILYQLGNHAPILMCIEALLDEEGQALIADPNRGVADRFPDAARLAGFHVEIEPVMAPQSPERKVNGRIFRLTTRR